MAKLKPETYKPQGGDHTRGMEVSIGAYNESSSDDSHFNCQTPCWKRFSLFLKHSCDMDSGWVIIVT